MRTWVENIPMACIYVHESNCIDKNAEMAELVANFVDRGAIMLNKVLNLLLIMAFLSSCAETHFEVELDCLADMDGGVSSCVIINKSSPGAGNKAIHTVEARPIDPVTGNTLDSAWHPGRDGELPRRFKLTVRWTV